MKSTNKNVAENKASGNLFSKHFTLEQYKIEQHEKIKKIEAEIKSRPTNPAGRFVEKDSPANKKGNET